MTTAMTSPLDSKTDSRREPRLESGDRLTRTEFERRYANSRDVHRAELVEGVVYVASTVRADLHGEPARRLAFWVSSYLLEAPEFEAACDSTVRLDRDNEVQPDLLLRIPEHLGGQSQVDDAGYVRGAPELVCEVAASSVSYDLHDKLHVYRRNGVLEYCVWRTEDRAIDWFTLTDGAFELCAPEPDGIHKSRTFPGLWLDTRALLTRDDRALLATLQAGTRSPEFLDWRASRNG